MLLYDFVYDEIRPTVISNGHVIAGQLTLSILR